MSKASQIILDYLYKCPKCGVIYIKHGESNKQCSKCGSKMELTSVTTE